MMVITTKATVDYSKFETGYNVLLHTSLIHFKNVKDLEQVWSESMLPSEDRLEEDPQSSQSQVEQRISDENTCGNIPWG